MTDIILNAVIFLITLIIVVFIFFRKDHNWDLKRGRSALRFFTAQSNVMCAAAALMMCFFPQSRAVWLLKYAGTAAVTVTMLNCKDLLRANAERGGEKMPHCNAMIRECIGYIEEILREKGKLR